MTSITRMIFLAVLQTAAAICVTSNEKPSKFQTLLKDWRERDQKHNSNNVDPAKKPKLEATSKLEAQQVHQKQLSGREKEQKHNFNNVDQAKKQVQSNVQDKISEEEKWRRRTRALELMNERREREQKHNSNNVDQAKKSKDEATSKSEAQQVEQKQLSVVADDVLGLNAKFVYWSSEQVQDVNIIPAGHKVTLQSVEAVHVNQESYGVRKSKSNVRLPLVHFDTLG